MKNEIELVLYMQTELMSIYVSISGTALSD